ncbi:MAG TPA: xanthine dehydrogenase family protein molybdopterin-binding subunit [Anaerolineae bacterium]|jgi:carbon-monoxide dehydrogenase large subunit|nr:xanthine dehydrogenase family protein molybdopterin-binding subunit [Anaerolineae bacterium]
MATRFFGERIKRNEDPRLLTGQALFVDDVHLPNMVHAAIVRSPYAHARIKSIDTSWAQEEEGVLAIYTAEDLGDFWHKSPLNVSPPPIEGLIFHERTHPILAKDKVRYVGEPVAIILAEDRYLAEDAAAYVDVDYEPLGAVVDLEKALATDSPLVHEDVGSNIAAHCVQTRSSDAGESYEEARSKADLVIKRRMYYDHGTAAAMENRGIVADWDQRRRRLTVWDTTQAPIPVRNGLAAILGLAENRVRVIAPFIGGGFGPKILMFYPEEMLVPWLAMQHGRPVKWIEDRSENFLATTQERDQSHDVEGAFTSDGLILGVRDEFSLDNGAYDPYGLTVPINTQCTLLGPYKVPTYYSEFKVIFTNKMIVTPYRGAGRQHGVFIMERLMDLAAVELGIDKNEIRRRNFIGPDEFPYDNQIIFQDFAPLVYDSGNFDPLLDKALEMIGYDEFVTKIQPSQRAEGRLVGIGVVIYVEGTGIGPYEGSRVQVESTGTVSVATGIGTQGQGHFTSFAQIVADQLGVDVADVEITTGDTDLFHWGTGTFASRGATVAGNAINEAALDVRRKVLKLASDLLEAAEEDLELVNGEVRVKGVPQRAIPLGELAAQANPLRGAVTPDTEPGLESTKYFGPKSGSTASGAHAMIVEIDPGTMDVKIQRYVVVHDAGRVINPLIVDGQIHGGVAQGIGNAFYEKIVYDDNGQLLSGSFMDYLVPTSTEVPPIDVGHRETPSPLNPLGIKGAGEAGAIPTGPLFAQAVENALQIEGLEILEIPLSPSRLWELVEEVKAE